MTKRRTVNEDDDDLLEDVVIYSHGGVTVLLPRVPAGRHNQHFLRGGGVCGGGD